MVGGVRRRCAGQWELCRTVGGALNIGEEEELQKCAAAVVKKLGFFNPTKRYCLGYSKLRHIVSLYASGTSWTEA